MAIQSTLHLQVYSSLNNTIRCIFIDMMSSGLLLFTPRKGALEHDLLARSHDARVRIWCYLPVGLDIRSCQVSQFGSFHPVFHPQRNLLVLSPLHPASKKRKLTVIIPPASVTRPADIDHVELFGTARRTHIYASSLIYHSCNPHPVYCTTQITIHSI